MHISWSERGNIPELRSNALIEAFTRFYPIILDKAREFEGKGNAGNVFILLACPCCDRNVFDPNKDIPPGTDLIICPIAEINTEELDSRYVVKKMKNRLPRMHSHESLLEGIFRGSGPSIPDSQESQNFLDEFTSLLTTVTDYMAPQ